MAPRDKRYSHVHRSNPLLVNNLFVDFPTWLPWTAAAMACIGQVIMLLCNASLSKYLPIDMGTALVTSHILKIIGETGLLYLMMTGMEVLQRFPKRLFTITMSLLLLYHAMALFVIMNGYGYISYTFMLTVYVTFLLSYAWLGLHIAYHYYGKFPVVGYLMLAYIMTSLLFNLILGYTGSSIKADTLSFLVACAYFVYARLRMTNSTHHSKSKSWL